MILSDNISLIYGGNQKRLYKKTSFENSFFIASKTPGEWLTRDSQPIEVTKDPYNEFKVERINVRSSWDITGKNLVDTVAGQISVGARLISEG